MKKLKDINVNQHSMIEEKILTRRLEIVNHTEHFMFIHIESNAI